MKKNDIEDLFKKSFENYEAEVSPSVWKNIRIGLKFGGLALLFNTLINKIGISTIITVLSSAAIITTVAIMSKSNKQDDLVSSAKTESPITPSTIIEKPIIVDVKKEEPNVEQQERNDNQNIDSKDNTTQKSDLTTENVFEKSTKNNKKKTESVINEPAEQPIATISTSVLEGTAPLIVELSNTGSGKTNMWSYNDGKKDKPDVSPIHIFETPGVYSVVLASTNAKGQTAYDSVKVEVTGNAPAPKDFSPNGDGVLDVFVFQTKNIASLSAKIFDKKGTVVYKSESTDAKWDGKDLQGKDAKEGVYFYFIKAEGLDGKKYEPKGAIRLTR